MKQIIITSQNGKTNSLNGCVGLGPGGNTVANNQSNKKGGCGIDLTSSEVLILFLPFRGEEEKGTRGIWWRESLEDSHGSAQP